MDIIYAIQKFTDVSIFSFMCSSGERSCLWNRSTNYELIIHLDLMSLRMSIIKCPTGATSFPEVILTGNKFPLETGALRLLQAPSMLFVVCPSIHRPQRTWFWWGNVSADCQQCVTAHIFINLHIYEPTMMKRWYSSR